MQSSASRSRDSEKGQKARRPEAARNRAAKWQQPNRIDNEMGPVSVDQRIGDESPDIGAAARQCAAEHDCVVIARRDESKCQRSEERRVGKEGRATRDAQCE